MMQSAAEAAFSNDVAHGNFLGRALLAFRNTLFKASSFGFSSLPIPTAPRALINAQLNNSTIALQPSTLSKAWLPTSVTATIRVPEYFLPSSEPRFASDWYEIIFNNNKSASSGGQHASEGARPVSAVNFLMDFTYSMVSSAVFGGDKLHPLDVHLTAGSRLRSTVPCVQVFGPPWDKQNTLSKLRSYSSCADQEEPGAGEGALKLRSGSMDIPHPQKRSSGGEDSHFVDDDIATIGVADGVGGWAEVGVDAGEYARQLMGFYHEAAARHGREADLLQLLVAAHARIRVQGSCTACVLKLQGTTLQAVNLGDSGFLVLRHGKVFFRSSPQQHDFNFPYQLGSESGGDGDRPEDAHQYSVPVQRGDVVVLGTDGLFDNVHDKDVAALVAEASARGRTPTEAAAAIVRLAGRISADRLYPSPFAKAAEEAGVWFRGGKPDDITVVVSFVE